MSDKKTIRQLHSVLVENETPSTEEYIGEDVDLYSIDTDTTEEVEFSIEDATTATDLDFLAEPTFDTATEEDETTQGMQEPFNGFAYDELIDTGSGTDTFAALLDDDYSAQNRDDAEQKADIFADQLMQDEEPEEKRTEPLEDLSYDELIDTGTETDISADQLMQDEEPEEKRAEPLADLSYDELIDSDSEIDTFADVFDDDFSAQSGDDTEQKADLLTDQLTLDEEPEEKRTEPLADLSYDELIDTGTETDTFTALLDDDYSAQSRDDTERNADLDRLMLDEEPEAERAEPLDELSYDALINTGAEDYNFKALLDDGPAGEGESDPEPQTLTEKNTTDQATSTTDKTLVAHTEVGHSVAAGKTPDKVAAREVVNQEAPLQPTEKKLHKSNDEVSGVSAIKKPKASLAPDIQKSVVENRQHTDSRPRKNLIIVAVLVGLVGTAGIWYGYNSTGKVSQLEQHQGDKTSQLSRTNLNRNAKPGVVQTIQPETLMEEAVSPVKTPTHEQKEPFEVQTRKNSHELLSLTKTTRQLEQRLSSVEEKLVGYDGRGQTDRVIELGQQLKILEQLVQESIATNQGVTEEITLQLTRLESSINQLENQVGQIRQQQDSLRNSISSVERKTAEMTTRVAAATERPDNTPSSEDDTPVLEESSEREKSTPLSTSNMERAPPQPEKKVSTEGVAPDQPKWAVNLASSTNRFLAEKELKKLKASGLETIIRKAQVRGITWYRIRIEGFTSTTTAREYMKDQLDHNKFEDAWVSPIHF